MTLFSNKSSANQANLNNTGSSEKAQEIKYLLSRPISINVVDLARSCLLCFQLFRKVKLPVLQCALYFRLYQIYAPEESDGIDGGNSQAFNSMLLQMAYLLGLNREPGNFRNVFIDERANNLGRKIWHYLIISDVIQAYMFGTPLTSKSMFYDTKTPFFKDGNENVPDFEVEKSIARSYMLGEELVKGPMKNILDLCLDMNKSVNISELTELLTKLEVCCDEKFGKLGEYVMPLETSSKNIMFEKVLEVTVSLSLKCFFLSLYCHLYLYYEKQNDCDLLFHYLQKCLHLTMTELISYFFPLIINPARYFGEGSELFVNPTLLQTIHRTIEIIISILLRVNSSLYKIITKHDHAFRIEYELSYRNHVVKLLKISEYLEKCAGVCIASMSQISNRYYYAWVITRSQKYLLKFVTNEKFYKETSDLHTGVSFSENQLQEIIEIIEQPIGMFKNIITENYNDENIRNFFVEKKESLSLFISTSTLHDTPKAQQSLLNSVYGNYSLSEHIFEEIISSEYEEQNFIDNPEIDCSWLQMLSFKNSRNWEGSRSDIYSICSPIANCVEPNDMLDFHGNEIQFKSRIQNSGFETSRYSDSFDLPFLEQIFNS